MRTVTSATQTGKLNNGWPQSARAPATLLGSRVCSTVVWYRTIHHSPRFPVGLLGNHPKGRLHVTRDCGAAYHPG